MHWRGRKILVTGGAGFLGSNLCHALAARGARVVALDGFLFGGGANPANLDGADVELVRGDIREIDLRSLCEGAEVIFNLAAQTSHMGGQRDPLADIAVNAVTPAAAKTAIFDQMSEQHIQFMLSKIPMGRFGTPEEVAAMVAWLCTEDCSFSTGAVFDLSGGRTTY